MAHVKLYDKDGDEKARAIQERVERAKGEIPPAHKAMGRSGAFMEAMQQLDRAAGANLDVKTRELIRIAVSAANGCDFCVREHANAARRHGVSEEEITAAVEVAGQMSAFNTFFKAIDHESDE